MVELNFDRRAARGAARPHARAPSCARVAARGRPAAARRRGDLHADHRASSAPSSPALGEASRTVGSPQIRNRGTVGGNLGTGSPAGDALPPLLACGRRGRAASARRATRSVPSTSSSPASKQNALRARRADPRRVLERAAAGPQQFSKIGTRNAMVIAVVLVRARAATRTARRSAPASARPRRRRRARRGRGRSRRGVEDAELWDDAGDARPRPPSTASASWSRPPRTRSTTSAARAAYRRHALARAGAPDARRGRWTSTRGGR